MTKAESAEQQVNPFDEARYAFKQSLYAQETPDLNPTTISRQLSDIREIYRETHKDKDLIALYASLSGLAGEALEVAKVRGVDEATVEGLKQLKDEYATITDALLAQAPRDRYTLPGDMAQAKGGTGAAEKEEYEIDRLNLDSQTRSYLVRLGIHSIDDLKEKLVEGKKISGIGKKRRKIIEDALAKLEEESEEKKDSPPQSS